MVLLLSTIQFSIRQWSPIYVPLRIIEFLITVFLPTKTLRNNSEFSKVPLTIHPEEHKLLDTFVPWLNFAGGSSSTLDKILGRSLKNMPVNHEFKSPYSLDSMTPMQR